MSKCVICEQEINGSHYGSDSAPMHYLCAELQQVRTENEEHRKELENGQ